MIIFDCAIIITYSIGAISMVILCFLLVKEVQMYRRSKEVYCNLLKINLEKFQRETIDFLLDELKEKDTLIYLDPNKYDFDNPDEPREEDYL